MKVNLGAGDDQRAGYLSVDLRPEVAEVVADVRRLPFADGSVSEVLALDVLEHFWRDQTMLILAEWRRVLRPDGLLVLRVPNLAELGARAARGMDLANVIQNIYGGHRCGPGGSWDTHHWGWTPATLTLDLAQARFRVVDSDREPNMTFRAVPT